MQPRRDVEGAYEQVSKRLDGIDRCLGSLEGKIDRQFLWVVGLLVVSIILPIADRFVAH